MKMQKVKKLICQKIDAIEEAQISYPQKVSLYEDVILLSFYIDGKLEKFSKKKLKNPMLWRVK
jgi:hypothetical protein